MHPHHVFLSVVVAVFFGLAIPVFFASWSAVIAILLGCGLLILAAVVGRTRLYVIALIVCAALGAGWLRGTAVIQTMGDIPALAGHAVTVTGVITRDPTGSMRGQRIPLTVRTCMLEDGTPCMERRLLIIAPPLSPLPPMRGGLSVSCTLERPTNFSPTFDYVTFLAKDGIRFLCQDAVVLPIPPTSLADRTLAALGRVRYTLETAVKTVVPEPAAALGLGLLFGGDDRMSGETQDVFRVAGLSHIVAVSGYNVTIIAYALVAIGVTCGLRRRRALWIAITGIALFVIMIGAPIPAVRAAIMGSILIILFLLGRLAQSLGVLLLASTLMAMHNPLLIAHDVGFQLSVAATAGIVMFYPLLERLWHADGIISGLLQIFATTVSAQIFVTPIIMYHFGVFSVVALAANLTVLPFIPIAMAAVLAASLAPLILPSVLAISVGFLAYASIMPIILLARFWAAIPYATIAVPLSAVALWGSYVLIANVYAILRRRLAPRCVCGG